MTYTPSADRILPSPSELHVRIKNTSAIPLRAAYLHGPYTLHVSAYPSTFNPNKKLENIKKYGVPEFEPNLKAGGNWTATLRVPEDIRESGDRTRHHHGKEPGTVTWIIELSSQILFSNTASVHYELLVGRDERSLEVGFAAVAGKGHGEPGHIEDFQQRTLSDSSTRQGLPKGVYSRAVELVAEDTAALWDKPALPKWKGEATNVLGEKDVPERKEKQKKIHLVILTHGLHSNVGADMLYMKESIDATAKHARRQARTRRSSAKKGRKDGGQKTDHSHKEKDSDHHENHQPVAPANLAGGQEELEDEEDEEDSDDEQVVVRGFSGNAVRTERGIQYLGKRLAKFVLTMTYPTQPHLPPSKSLTRKLTGSLGKSNSTSSRYGEKNAAGTVPGGDGRKSEDLPYVISSISFIGHSLGGLVQTYAIAYIHKHSPEFFKLITPINFVTMASPMLGLSNENPLYVKFALDFGLVGRTGQDLGLTWRAPTLARSGWSAVISGFGVSSNKEEHDDKQPDPRSKPLLRILPTGPAHEVLKMFRNRTLYSNVVNDGIVPLRTSCLLFLDWRGLEKVEGARRENGLITTMASFGWAELTGANSNSHRPSTARLQDEMDTPQDSGDEKALKSDVPHPSQSAASQDQEEPAPHQFLDSGQAEHSGTADNAVQRSSPKQGSSLLNPINDIINIFRPSSSKTPKVSKKYTRSIQRAQTIKPDGGNSTNSDNDGHHSSSPTTKRPLASRGDTFGQDYSQNLPPPKTSVFEAAGDLISPPLPPASWFIDPSKRARTIFHDRIYHPSDIPPPQTRRPRFGRSFSSTESLRSSNSSTSYPTIYNNGSGDDGGMTADFATGMKVEEKIARAYHRDLSWRKVLVRLEPDAHNNMVVRRMFANAYGWDVIKHLCDTHFSDNAATSKPDAQESNHERAKPEHEPVGDTGSQVNENHDDADDEHEHEEEKTSGNSRLDTVASRSSTKRPDLNRTNSEKREASDALTSLDTQSTGISHLVSQQQAPSTPHAPRRASLLREDSALWTDAVFDDTEPDSDDEALAAAAAQAEKKEGAEVPADVFEKIRRLWNGTSAEDRRDNASPSNALPTAGARPRPSPHRSQTHSHIRTTSFPDPSSPVAKRQKEEVPNESSHASTTGLGLSMGLQKPPQAVLATSPPLGEGLRRDESGRRRGEGLGEQMAGGDDAGA